MLTSWTDIAPLCGYCASRNKSNITFSVSRKVWGDISLKRMLGFVNKLIQTRPVMPSRTVSHKRTIGWHRVQFSQMTSKHAKECCTIFLPHFDVICDLLNRRTVTCGIHLFYMTKKQNQRVFFLLSASRTCSQPRRYFFPYLQVS